MRRLIALSAFISLFATTSFVATNSIESSMFSSYKEFSGLFAKKGGKHKGNSNNGKGNDNDYGYGEGEQKCGDGRINQVSEECEKDAECNDDDKECKDCKCVDKPKEKQCNDPSARKDM